MFKKPKPPIYIRAKHERENREAHERKVLTNRRKANKLAKAARRRNRK